MPRPHLNRTGVLVLLLLAILLCGAWTGVRLLLAKSQLETARSQLTVARTALVARDIGAATAAVNGAGTSTRKARNLTHDPVTWAWAHLPLLGRNVAVVRGVAAEADDIANDVLPPALRTAQDVDPEAVRRPDGSIDLALLQRVSPVVQPAATKVQQVRRKAHALPSSLLIAPVADARREFITQVDELTDTVQNAADALRVAPAFLGASGTRRWFVMVQQNGESRGTGGIIGGYAVLEAKAGKLTVLNQGSNADLKSGSISTKGFPADYVARYELDGAFDLWPNINLSPDLPTVAKVVAAKWRAQGGAPVNGVIALDAQALSELLKGGPPIDVGAGKTVTAEQLPDYLAVGQYVGVAAGPSGLASRKDQLSGIARQVLSRLTTGGGSSRALLTGVVDALQSGHVHFATEDKGIAPVLARTGLDGALPRGPAPVAYAVVNNASGGKLDSFLDRTVLYEGATCSGGRRDTRITVTLRSGAPPSGSLPEYVMVNSAGAASRNTSTGRVLLAVYGTRGAVLRSATLNGEAVSTLQDVTTVRLQESREAGLPVWQVPVDTPPGKQVRLVLRLDEPSVAGPPRLPIQPLSRRELQTDRLDRCG